MRVLVIDDLVLVAEENALLVGDLGLSAVTVYSGNAACALLADGEQFDAIITDMRMPDGDGLTLLNFLRARQLSIPTLLHSNDDITMLNSDIVPLCEVVREYPFAVYASKAAPKHIEQFLVNISSPKLNVAAE